MKNYRILKQNKNCILLERKNDHYYKVYDVEGDVLCMTPSYEVAEQSFNTFDIEEIHRQQRENFIEKLKEIADA